MPHAELHYSADLDLDASAFLAEIERIIAAHDSGAGACKGRAYRAEIFHHTHILVTLALLAKPHRDDRFTTELMTAVEAALKARLDRPCHVSLSLSYQSTGYSTGYYEPSQCR